MIPHGTDMLSTAIVIATNAHHGQFDKAGAQYILHPLRVMLAVDGLESQIVAVLHDAFEDCPRMDLRLVETVFGQAVHRALDAITRRKDETYDDYLKRVRSSMIAMRVKIADARDNACVERFRNPTDAQRAKCLKYEQTARELEDYLFEQMLSVATGT